MNDKPELSQIEVIAVKCDLVKAHPLSHEIIRRIMSVRVLMEQTQLIR